MQGMLALMWLRMQVRRENKRNRAWPSAMLYYSISDEGFLSLGVFRETRLKPEMGSRCKKHRKNV